METYMNEFMPYLRIERKLSGNTLESYQRDVLQYLDFLAGKGITSLTEVPYDIFKQYVEAQLSQGRAPTTVNRTMASVRSYYRFLMINAVVNINPTIGIESPRIERRKVGYLTEEEVQHLLGQPDKIGLKGIRDKAMLELVYTAGVRVHELIALNMGDLDVRNRFLRCGEPGKDRFIPIEESCVHTVQEYLELARPFMQRDRNEIALFINTNGGRLSRQGFWKIIKKYASQAGIEKDITPHMLRQALAVHMLRSGREPEEVKAILGRADLTSLSEYIPTEK